jgi:alkylhydroperoxidase family enzyme
MARLPYVEIESATPAVREAFDVLPVQLNVFKMMAHAETCFRPFLQLGGAILGHQRLDAKLRELMILRVARLSSAQYEWVQHEAIARGVGATEAQVDAIARGTVDAECFDPTETLVLRFTTEVVEGVKASPATFAEMQQHFSPQEIVELLLAIGFYMTVARVTESTETDLDGPVGAAVVDAAKVTDTQE